MESGENSRRADVLFFRRVDECIVSEVRPDWQHRHGFEADDSKNWVAKVLDFGYLFFVEGDGLATELVCSVNLCFLNRASSVLSNERAAPDSDLGFLAVWWEIYWRGLLWFLMLEQHETLDADLEARSNLE